MLTKTIESAITVSTNKKDVDTELIALAVAIDALIDEIGANGGWYVGDGINMNVRIAYNQSTDKIVDYDIPVNDQEGVDRINNLLEKEYSIEYREKNDVSILYTTEYHEIKFLKKVAGSIHDILIENGHPTSGKITVTTTATYEPENK